MLSPLVRGERIEIYGNTFGLCIAHGSPLVRGERIEIVRLIHTAKRIGSPLVRGERIEIRVRDPLLELLYVSPRMRGVD